MNHLILTRYVVSENEKSIKSLEDYFNAQLKKTHDKSGTKDPLANQDFKKSFKKEVRKSFEGLYKKLSFQSS